MLTMENIVKELATNTVVHKDFRLFISSMPTKYFPVAVSEGSVMISCEPEKDLIKKIQLSLDEVMVHDFDTHGMYFSN